MSQPFPTSIDATVAMLAKGNYLAARDTATSIYLAGTMNRPLLLEGEAGVGKTETARAIAKALDRPLVRLQCHEGMDIHQALYEWNHPAQIMAIRLAEASGNKSTIAEDIYSRRFLLRRPLLEALESPTPAVLLIDELDRADPPFEAFLLEALEEFQVSIPEWGVVKAEHPPLTLLTSNRTREIHDALRRRCLYSWVDFPDIAREEAILAQRAPGVGTALGAQIASFVAKTRKMDMFKPPGVAESVAWAQALLVVGARSLDVESARATMGALLKRQEDITRLDNDAIAAMLAPARD